MGNIEGLAWRTWPRGWCSPGSDFFQEKLIHLFPFSPVSYDLLQPRQGPVAYFSLELKMRCSPSPQLKFSTWSGADCRYGWEVCGVTLCCPKTSGSHRFSVSWPSPVQRGLPGLCSWSPYFKISCQQWDSYRWKEVLFSNNIFLYKFIIIKLLYSEFETYRRVEGSIQRCCQLHYCSHHDECNYRRWIFFLLLESILKNNLHKLQNTLTLLHLHIYSYC